MAIEQPRQLPLSLCSSDEGDAPFNLGFAGLLTAGISNSIKSAGWTARRLAVLQSLMERGADKTVSLNGLNVKLFSNKASSGLFPESSIAAMLMGQDYVSEPQSCFNPMLPPPHSTEVEIEVIEGKVKC